MESIRRSSEQIQESMKSIGLVGERVCKDFHNRMSEALEPLSWEVTRKIRDAGIDKEQVDIVTQPFLDIPAKSIITEILEEVQEMGTDDVLTSVWNVYVYHNNGEKVMSKMEVTGETEEEAKYNAGVYKKLEEDGLVLNQVHIHCEKIFDIPNPYPGPPRY